MATEPLDFAALLEGLSLPDLGQLNKRERTQPFVLDDLLKLARQPARVDATPIPQGDIPGAHSYAPQGTIFLGGSPFPVNERPAMIQNGLVLATRLAETLSELRRQQAKAKAAKPPASSSSK